MSRNVVMVHGMWGTPAVWTRFRGLFEARGWNVVTPALRHHQLGTPPPPEFGRTSLADYVEDIAGAIAGLPAKPALIGHSMGGLIGQLIAARGLVSAAVLLCPAPPAGVLALSPSALWAFARIESRWGWWRRPHLPSFAAARFGSFNTMPAEQAAEEYRGLVPDSGRALLEIGLPFLDSRRAATVDAARIACPLLVIGAERDRLIPPRTVRAIAARYGRHARYREFAGQGHFVVAQPGWQEVAAASADWLEQQPAPGAAAGG